MLHKPLSNFKYMLMILDGLQFCTNVVFGNVKVMQNLIYAICGCNMWDEEVFILP